MDSAMGSMQETKYITKNRGVFYYTRSIPKDVRGLDDRPNPIQKSLNTKNLDIAMSRRDVRADADERLWRSLRVTGKPFQSASDLAVAGNDLMELFGTERVPTNLPSLPNGKAGATLHDHYQEELKEIFAGPADGLLSRFETWLVTLPADIADMYRRMMQNAQKVGPVAVNFDDPSQFVRASMGDYSQSDDENLKLSKALEDFFEKFAVAKMDGMSKAQETNYRNPKKRAVARFIEQVGDVPLKSITRNQAILFKDHWLNLIHRPVDGAKSLTRSGALKELQDLSYIWQCYADEHNWLNKYGQRKENPFADLKKQFPAPQKTSPLDSTEARVTFSTAIIREKWLQGAGLTGTNEQVRRILYTIVETGCGPQELLHLTAEKIRLDHPIPHILIAPTLQGELRNKVKTNCRVRAVPLVGIAFESIKRHPEGFLRYYDKSNAFSATANKFLLGNGLRTEKTTVYSLRHEYTDRLRQNAVPEHIQRHITGHATDIHGRYGAFPDDPDFDDKLQEMACWMEKAALPFDVNVV
nr:DUF6538 domain-containing protein [uncultured Cohaesibacter sp.]